MRPARFFGEGAIFALACDAYGRKNEIPAEILKEGMALGDPKYIGFLMGFCFFREVKKSKIDPPTFEELTYIGTHKFPLGGPDPFIAGYKRGEALP